jgi:hypothetical protein
MSLSRTLRELEKYTRLIKESYIFDEEEMDMPMHDEEPMMDDEKSMGGEMSSMGDATEKINQIRSMALEGIQMFAENVDSEEYDFFKKIWLMCDKVMSEKDTVKGEE